MHQLIPPALQTSTLKYAYPLPNPNIGLGHVVVLYAIGQIHQFS